jgi:hypothetical protein
MIKCFISGFFLVSLVFSLDVNFSLETKYGDGNKVTSQDGTPVYSDYKFIENILDINSTFDNGIFISTQLEYSDPPVLGASVKGLNNFVIDYMGDNYSVKLGNLYSLYGRGLSLNMTQNQNIDYDNSLLGSELKYDMDEISFFMILGASEFNYRSKANSEQNDLVLNNNVFFLGSEIFTNKVGSLLISFLHQESIITNSVIYKYWSKELFDVGTELKNRFTFPDILPSVDDTLNTIDYNLAWNYQFLGADFYIEKVWNTYTKILGNTESGSKLYLSLYFDIAGTGVTYEYKNYDQKYYIPTLAGSPIGFREGNSTLASRNNHAINWGDEVGHQIELNRSIGDFQWMGNISFAYKHPIDGYEPISFSQIFKMNNEDDIYHQYPFRQYYSELSGYSLNDKVYFKIGIDQFDEFKIKSIYGSMIETERVSALTFPSMITLDIGGGYSITSYIEYQNRDFNLQEGDTPTKSNNYKVSYFSMTYNHSNLLSFSIFYEDEQYEKKELFIGSSDKGIDVWRGYDITVKVNSTSQFSVFYGSQKGGLVCANGVCSEQPGFDDGIKVTLRSIF